MTTEIDPNGKAHHILHYLSFGWADLEDVLHAVAPLFNHNRSKISHRLRMLCRAGLVCWNDPCPEEPRFTPSWWANCGATFRLTYEGKQVLAALGSPVERHTVRWSERAA